ncbi:PREDICTED: outer dense fiber protein 1 [Chaetura pelagica]|uniref:outer dense fiber protein 1 n=1 Tax=Chaetura pelagica TaxID=8897 RepID=UPI0005239F19|nr:PREDICTED: outer dense fiber protein 1 [Chaetura pelagica]
MSWHKHLWEEAEQELRQMEREMAGQMRLLQQQLQQLKEMLPAACLGSPAMCPCCLRPWERGTLTRRSDAEQEVGSRQRSRSRTLNSSRDDNLLASMDIKGFDPKEVTVTVKDGKVKVLAEHEEKHTTARGKEYKYRNFTREISLPPGVREDEVTYSLKPNSILKIEKSRG